MVWQDIVIAISNLLFTYSLVWQVAHGFKKKKGFLTLQASLLTTIGLYAVAIAFFSMKLYFSTIVAALNGTLWLILLFQRLSYGQA